MPDLAVLRSELTNDEAQLLEAIWRFHVQEQQWIPAMELHRRGGGRRRVREILAGLGGASVLLNGWDIEPFYRVWPTLRSPMSKWTRWRTAAPALAGLPGPPV